MACTAPTATHTKCSSPAWAASTRRCGPARTCRPGQSSSTEKKESPMQSRRRFVSQSAAVASAVAFPLVAGALMAIGDINAAAGIESLGGAKLQALLGDAQSQPQAGAAEVEKMNEAGV